MQLDPDVRRFLTEIRARLSLRDPAPLFTRVGSGAQPAEVVAARTAGAISLA